MQAVPFQAFARAAVALAAAAALGASAQPVRLHFASNLCNSMTSQVLASQQVPPLSSTASPGASVNTAMVDHLERDRDQFFNKLDAVVPFSGLYVTGMADGTDTQGNRYSAGVEWELFDQGRGEAHRNLERAKIDSKTQYVQLLRDMEDRQLQENLLAIEQMRNKLMAMLWKREAEAIRPVLEKRKQELAAGRATRADLADIEYQSERAELGAQTYGEMRDVLVYPASQDLINRIEDVQLRPVDDLLQLAADRSPDMQMQDLVARRSELLPSYKDHTSVRLYVERNRDLEPRSPYNAAGVRIRIPIGNDQARDAAAEVTQELAHEQQDAIRAALAQKLELLSERFRLKQHDMKVLQAQSRMTRQKAELACYRMDHPVSALPDADQDVENYTVQLHELQRQILSARLDVLEALTQISAVVKPKEPQELYVLSAK